MLAFQVQGDGEEPGAELPVDAKVVTRSVQLQKGLLHQVVGLFLRMQLLPHYTQQDRGVAGEQFVERASVSGNMRRHQGFVRNKGSRRLDRILPIARRQLTTAKTQLAQSGTRREEKILAPEVLEGVTLLRRSLISLSPVQAMEDLTRTQRKFPTNKEFLARVAQVM